MTYKQLTQFGNEETETLEEEEEKIKEESEHLISKDKSFHTNSTSTANFKDGFCLDSSRKMVGLVFKCNLEELIKKVFLILKEMTIVWKPWNSEYIYKCQSGIPVNESSKNDADERMQEFYQNDLLKFFLHFSIIPKRKEILEFDPRARTEAEYLISFIWIKGNTLKYLNFVSLFEENIKTRI